MKIFWSWQSDTPGKTGRFLVRDALREAIEQLKEAPDIEEPTSQSTREALHLDHDIQGVTGSPDLARTIFEKIDLSEIVVADVSLVGRVVTTDPTTSAKKLINSNVAIELGYALRVVSDRKVLLVFNAHYGKHEDLPFDLRHKGGAIVFSLPPDADNQMILAERKKLKEQFLRALKPLVHVAAPPMPFPETPSTFTKAAYFDNGQILGRAGSVGRDQVTYSYEADSFCYIRLIPVRPLPAELPLSLLKKAVQRVPLLSRNYGVVTDHNEFGAIGLEPNTHPSDGAARIRASTQLFQNGEIWSISSDVIVRGPEPGHPADLKFSYPFLPSLMFERVYYDCLRTLTEFSGSELNLMMPWTVELGLTGVTGLNIVVDINPFERFWGPMRRTDVVRRRILNELNSGTLDTLLLEFFSTVYDAAGQKRPEGFCGFPPDRPGSKR